MNESCVDSAENPVTMDGSLIPVVFGGDTGARGNAVEVRGGIETHLRLNELDALEASKLISRE